MAQQIRPLMLERPEMATIPRIRPIPQKTTLCHSHCLSQSLTVSLCLSRSVKSLFIRIFSLEKILLMTGLSKYIFIASNNKCFSLNALNTVIVGQKSKNVPTLADSERPLRDHLLQSFVSPILTFKCPKSAVRSLVCKVCANQWLKYLLPFLCFISALTLHRLFDGRHEKKQWLSADTNYWALMSCNSTLLLFSLTKREYHLSNNECAIRSKVWLRSVHTSTSASCPRSVPDMCWRSAIALQLPRICINTN